MSEYDPTADHSAMNDPALADYADAGANGADPAAMDIVDNSYYADPSAGGDGLDQHTMDYGDSAAATATNGHLDGDAGYGYDDQQYQYNDQEQQEQQHQQQLLLQQNQQQQHQLQGQQLPDTIAEALRDFPLLERQRILLRLQRNRAAKRITETEDAAMLKLGEEFDKAECLMLSEVKLLLEADRETKIKKSGEASLNEIFQKTLAYAQRFSTLKNEDTIKEVRSLLVEAEVFKPFENAQLANLGCQDSDEAFALIPSLANKISGEDLQHYLNEIQNFTKFQG